MYKNKTQSCPEVFNLAKEADEHDGMGWDGMGL